MAELPYILLVEDSEDDIVLTLRALKKAKLANPVQTVRDGAEAVDFLLARGEYSARDAQHLPQLVLLDINLPKLNGIEVLRQLRSDELTRSLPVVMLSTSMQDNDVDESYANGANSYIRKPVSSKDFREAIKTVSIYWLSLNTPPPGRN